MYVPLCAMGYCPVLRNDRPVSVSSRRGSEESSRWLCFCAGYFLMTATDHVSLNVDGVGHPDFLSLTRIGNVHVLHIVSTKGCGRKLIAEYKIRSVVLSPPETVLANISGVHGEHLFVDRFAGAEQVTWDLLFLP